MPRLDEIKVKVKPVYIGLHHYRRAWGSVCSPDLQGTPQVSRLTREEAEGRAAELAEAFRRRAEGLGFVEVEEPFVAIKPSDLYRLPGELTMDTDAILLGTYGAVPLEVEFVRRLGLPVIGPEASPDFLKALRAEKFLLRSKALYLGEIPSFSAPQGPWDFGLVADRLGPTIRQVDLAEFFLLLDAVGDSEAREVVGRWLGLFEKVVEPEEGDLLAAAKVYIALRRLCDEEGANALTVNCGRLTELKPVVPCFPFSTLIDEGIVCGCEGDITALLSALLLHAVSEGPVTMGNFGDRPGRFGAREGEVTIEHDVLPPSMCRGRLVARDYHGRRFGLTAYGEVSREPVTLLNISTDLTKICAVEGKVRESEDGGHCRVIVHIEVEGDVERVPQIRVGSQHFSMAFGRWLGAIEEFARLKGMELLSL